MSENLAINGGTPVLKRNDYGNWPIITEDDRRFINEVLDSGIVAGGTAPQVAALEREWAEYVGSKHCLTTTSGTAALHMALAAIGAGPGDEIITSAFTFLASASCASAPERHPGVRRHRPAHLQHGPGQAGSGDHRAHQGDHPGAYPGAVGRPGSDHGDCAQAQPVRDRGRLPVARRRVQGQEGRHLRRHRHLQPEQLQEPVRRRGRSLHHRRRGLSAEGRPGTLLRRRGRRGEPAPRLQRLDPGLHVPQPGAAGGPDPRPAHAPG